MEEGRWKDGGRGRGRGWGNGAAACGAAEDDGRLPLINTLDGNPSSSSSHADRKPARPPCKRPWFGFEVFSEQPRCLERHPKHIS